ncbi:MAG: ABC transporter permease [Burkholderiales bacterium]|jgi:sulfonate transport system permease protein
MASVAPTGPTTAGEATPRERPASTVRFRAFAVAWVLPLGALAAWWTGSALGWVAPQLLPAPTRVADTLHELVASGELWHHVGASLWRVIAGFTVGAATGLALGVAMGASRLAKDYLYPSFKAFAQVPVIGWLPLLMLLVGLDETLKVLLIAKAAAVPVAVNTVKALENVPVRYLEVARVFGYTRSQLLLRVVLPATLGPVWTGLRYGLTHAWLALVVVELLAGSEGLGFLVVYGRQLFQLDLVLAAVVVVGAFGFALDRLLAVTEARLGRWRREAF